MGAILTILGLGTWALAAQAPSSLIMPAWFGAGFLLIGAIQLKRRELSRPLLWVAIVLAVVVIAMCISNCLEALRISDGTPLSPLTLQQVTAVLICTGFVFMSVWRFFLRRTSQA